MANNIWWDQDKIDEIRTGTGDKTYPGTPYWVEPAGINKPYPSGHVGHTDGKSPGCSIHSIPCVDREPVIGDYIIFTDDCDSIYKGYITSIEKITDGFSDKKLYYNPNPGKYSKDSGFAYLGSHNHTWYTIDPKFVEAMQWDVVDAEFEEKSVSTFLGADKLTKNRVVKSTDPRCPKCGGALGSWQLAPWCKKCNMIQPEINGIFINRAY